MAKGATAPRVMVVQAPTKKRSVRRAAGRVAKRAKQTGGRLVRAAWEERLAGSAIIGAGLVGYADGAGMLDDIIPDVGLGRPATLAALAFFGGTFLKMPRVRQAGIGLASAAAFGYGHEQGRKKKT